MKTIVKQKTSVINFSSPPSTAELKLTGSQFLFLKMTVF